MLGVAYSERTLVLSIVLSVMLATAYHPVISPQVGSQFDQSSDASAQLAPATHTVTRKQAVIDYIVALYSDDGYFHGYLNEPPCDGLLGLHPGVYSVYRGHASLKALNATHHVDWNAPRELLLGLVNGESAAPEYQGLINFTQHISPDMSAQATGMALMQDLGCVDHMDTDLVMAWVADQQLDDGGFQTCEDLPPRTKLTYTYFAVSVLAMFEYLDLIDRDAAENYVLNCWNEDGGFGLSPGRESDSGLTPLALMTLQALGRMSDLNHTKVLQYELQDWDNETGCDSGGIVGTERALWSFDLLGALDIMDTEKTVEWILSCQSHIEGAFRVIPGDDSDRLEFCRAAIHALEILDSLTSLESLFTVQKTPVWEVPQWYLDKISEIGTTSGSSPAWMIVFPDLSMVIDSIVVIAPISVCLVPLAYVLYTDRRERIERRRIKKMRSKG